ncbi:MAG: C25 family cysteine peptidase, partial [Candidatus Cloacimonadaceae bacterium]|nr:C25 family cysteine peptidase [Candidatus Cloacimonadaceae bacterium]
MSPKILFRIAVLVLLLTFMCGLFASERTVSFSPSNNQILLLNNSDSGFDIEFNLGAYSLQEIKTKAGTFDLLTIDGYAYTNKVGDPKLPQAKKIIAVPVGADVRFTISTRNSIDLSSGDTRLRNQIIPAQEPISKSDDPDLLPFIYNADVYRKNSFTSNELFSVTEIGFMRGVRLYEIDFIPISYNPVTGAMQLTHTLVARVDFVNPDRSATENLRAKTASWEFENLYSKTIFNWRPEDRPSLVRYPTKMLILTPSAYVSTLQPFVDWKRQQGLNVIVTTVGTGGTVANTTTAIQSYMQGLWNSATAENPAPTYLLIVGDHGTTGDNITANTGSTSSAHITDLNYVRLNGTDYLPEMYYGRFSVSSATELTNIINKTLMFQQTTMPDLSYLGKTVLIAGVDASWAPSHGNGAINYATTHYFNAANGIVSNNYLYPASGSSSAAIIANANEGRGYLNYTAHGSETSWADPVFNTTHVNNMTNTDKYFVAVGNCCVTNKFNHSAPCFGEAIIRAPNRAGVIYIGGTNNTYWDEDYWWAVGYKTPISATPPAYNPNTLGAYDAMFHTHNEAFADWAQTTGETVYMGNMAVQASTSSRKNYYWEIYAIMGDPSLMPYYGVPAVNNATYPAQILIGASSINVTAAPYSRVALTMNGVLHGTAIVGTSGSISLPFTPFTTVGTAKLVITRSNYRTVMSDISIIPNSGPYVSVSNVTYTDTNNNTPEYNETGRFNVSFHNVGSVTASNVTATLACATPGISITDNTESIASIAAGTTVTRTNAYTFNIANNIAHGTTAAFTITMVSGANTWEHNFSLELNAPQLAFGNITILDPTGNNNGRLDPGETVTVLMPIANSGGAASLSGNAILTSPTAGI